MDTLKFLFFFMFVGVAVLGYQLLNNAQPNQVTDADQLSNTTSSFTRLPIMNGANPNTVMVIAAQNCSGDAAQRADKLANDLKSKGIPVQRTQNISFTLNDSTKPAEIDQMYALLAGPLPTVVVNGRGKSNPSLDEVIAEFTQAP